MRREQNCGKLTGIEYSIANAVASKKIVKI